MPVQPLAPQQQAQPVYEISEADKKRQQAIQAAWAAYDGEFEAQLQKTPEGIDPNVVINQCAPIVDTGIDFLFGQELQISVDKDSPKEAQVFLDDVWGIKEQRIPLLQDLGMNGAMARNAFLRIVPSSDKPGKQRTFRLVAVDPSTIFVQTAPQDCETVLLYCIEYCSDEKRDGKPVRVYYREEITRIDPDGDASRGDPDDDDTWQIQHWTQVGNMGMQPKNTGWTPAGEPYTWPYPFPPLFHCKNLPRPNEFWGRADIRPDIIAMNKSLNLVQSGINLVELLYGTPTMYGNGMGDGTIDRSPGRIIQLPLIESKITAVAITSDVPNALAFANDLRSSIDETSSVPGVATGRIKDMPRGNLSGIAIELLFMSLLKQTQKKQCLYGKLIIDVSKALLVLNGMSGDIGITLAWQNPLPHDDLASAQYATLLKNLGISDTTIQRNLGFDPEEEARLNAEEDAEKIKQFSRGQGFPPAQPVPPEQQQPGQDAQQQQSQGATA